jgi:hypothetical protein
MNTCGVVEGGIYRHYKGGVYRVVTLAFREDDRALIVVYTRVVPPGHEAAVWARPASEFLGYAEAGRRRYELLEEPGRPGLFDGEGENG